VKNIDVNFKMYSDLLKSEIGAALLPLGFRGASGRWYFEGNQVVGVLALRKSTHGKYYYLEIPTARSPASYTWCSMQGR